MRFEWDGKKAAANLRTHRVAFDEAVTVFYDPLAATFGDPDHSQEESRLIMSATPPVGDSWSCAMWSAAPQLD